MTQLNRRHFLQASAAAFAAPYIIPSRAFGANERVTIAAIGVRNQGLPNMKGFISKGCNVAAICDVDSQVLGAAIKAATDLKQNPQGYSDYRKVLERKDVDAVIITTPDHWHALMTINACQAGKDVYCEKPLTLTIAEGRRMVNAARQHNRVVQTGSQQRSGDEFWKAVTLVRNGKIGKIQKVLVGVPKSNHPGPLPPNSTAPANLDFDMWLGPAPSVPYNEKKVHYNFRFWWDYSGGQMTNFGAHHLDIAQWALDMDNSGPIWAGGSATFAPSNVSEVTETCRITYKYENGVEVVLGQLEKDIPQGITFIGENGQIFVNRGKLAPSDESLLKSDFESLPVQVYRGRNHHEDFLKCIKTREKPAADVEIGHRSATVCHLANLVARLGREIKWDPKNEKVIGDDEAHAMTDKEYRKPWAHDTAFVAT